MTPETEKLLRYVGLCKRAGGVIRGAESIEKALPKKPACVLLANDASDRTMAQFERKCESHAVPFYKLDADKFDLAKAVGATSPCAAIAILPGKGPADMVKTLAMEHSQE